MPTPSRIGTPSQINASAASGSVGVTVPVGCNAVVAFWSHWDGNAGAVLSTLTLGGVSLLPALVEQADGWTADCNGQGAAILLSPSTGAQTLAWAWSAGGAQAEGGEIVLVYVQDANLADAVRDADSTSTAGVINATLTLTTALDDLLLVFAESFSGTNPDPDGTEFINDAAINQHVFDVGELTPAAGSTTINMTGENYSSLVAVALKASSGGAPEEHSGAAALSGGGAQSSVGTKAAGGAATLAGGGAQSSAGTKGALGGSSVVGGGAPGSAGTKEVSGAAALSGGGNVTAEGGPPQEASGAVGISGGGSVRALGRAIGTYLGHWRDGEFLGSVKLKHSFNDRHGKRVFELEVNPGIEPNDVLVLGEPYGWLVIRLTEAGALWRVTTTTAVRP